MLSLPFSLQIENSKSVSLVVGSQGLPQCLAYWQAVGLQFVFIERMIRYMLKYILRFLSIHTVWGFPVGSGVKNPPANAGDMGSWVRKIPWRRRWQHTPVFLPGKSHGQRSLAVHGVAKNQT